MSEETIENGSSAKVCHQDADNTLPVSVESDEKARKLERKKLGSRLTLSSYTSAALMAEAYSAHAETDFTELQEKLLEQCRQAHGGNLQRAESMLVSQSHSLDVIFTRLALDASVNFERNIHAAEIYLRLALKAQAQCRATVETLAAIKNPPVVFARQANITNGPQQVNNGAASSRAHAGQKKIRQTRLLEPTNGKRLDTGKAGQAIGGDQAVAAVEVIHRSANRRRQG